MKKPLLFFLFANILPALSSIAQIPFNTIDSINVNNINVSVLVHGDMGWTGGTVTYNSKSFFPNGSNNSINFAHSIWMSAYDGAGQLHVAAQTYRQDGNDYWPGPLDSHDSLTYADSYAWAKIWKVNRSDIQTFCTTSPHTIINTPNVILTWPAKGNTYAQGNGGIYLTITDDMAPFVDLNGNGIYEPLLGEYPEIKGDQALWRVFSDNGPTHSQSHGKPLGAEVHAMTYAFKRGTLIDNVIYHEYKIINKSSNNYTGMRVGQWDDVEIGYGFDDYVGFDSTWRMGITYNSTNDDGGSAGHPVGSYGQHAPHTGMTMVKLPGDVGMTHVPAGAFDYYNNDFSIIGNPTNDTQCNYLLHGQLRNGIFFRNTFRGVAIPCGPADSGSVTNYVYPGDPSNPNAWSECSCMNSPGDRRFVLSSNDFDFSAGSFQTIVIAFVVADSAGGCGAPTSFDKIRTVADTAWGNYFKTTGIKDIHSGSTIKVYPSPAHDKLTIECAATISNDRSMAVYNALGQQVNVSISGGKYGYAADVKNLPPGIYYLRILDGTATSVARFIKQ